MGDMTVVEGEPALALAPDTLRADIAVVGGGPTGMLAALCAADAGWDVAMIAPPLKHDPRTTAILMPGIELIQELGAWDALEEAVAPLVTMRIIDATDRLPRAPEIAFDAHEIGLDQFGYNTPNDALNAALAERIGGSGIAHVEVEATSVVPGAPVHIHTDGPTVVADFVIAADGSQSIVRQDAGLGVRRWQYDQSAFVTTMSHERPHGDTSTEFHTPAGPFTLVPLPGDRSSLVWVSRPDDAQRWAAMDPGPLAREIENRAYNILGRIKVDGPRGVIPMEAMVAKAFGRDNIALVGEAGHRFPPIGAQGLNLGLRDVAVLRRLLTIARQTGKLSGVAADYDRRRQIDVNARTAGVDVLNRSLLADFMPISVARAVAFAAARNIAPLRRVMMRVGLG